MKQRADRRRSVWIQFTLMDEERRTKRWVGRVSAIETKSGINMLGHVLLYKTFTSLTCPSGCTMTGILCGYPKTSSTMSRFRATTGDSLCPFFYRNGRESPTYFFVFPLNERMIFTCRNYKAIRPK